MSEPDFQLPIIDLSLAKTDRKNLGGKVVDALENVGFLYIDNTDGLDYAMLFKCCEWFFGQPWEVKKKMLRKHWNADNNNVFRGYFPVVELEASRKEGFECGRDHPPDDPSLFPGNWFCEPSVWPEEDGSFPFKSFVDEVYGVMHEISMEILRLAAIGLDMEENLFEYLFNKNPCSTFRLMHYPPWEGAPPENAMIEDGKVLTTPDHTDTPFLTLLYTFNYTGLEVLTADGKWHAVKPRPNSLIMNIGDVFSRMTGGRFKATHHRVIDIGVDRFSVPFFLEPHYDADIAINLLSEKSGSDSEHVAVKYGPFYVQQAKHVKKYFEYKVLPDLE